MKKIEICNSLKLNQEVENLIRLITSNETESPKTKTPNSQDHMAPWMNSTTQLKKNKYNSQTLPKT